MVKKIFKKEIRVLSGGKGGVLHLPQKPAVMRQDRCSANQETQSGWSLGCRREFTTQ